VSNRPTSPGSQTRRTPTAFNCTGREHSIYFEKPTKYWVKDQDNDVVPHPQCAIWSRALELFEIEERESRLYKAKLTTTEAHYNLAESRNYNNSLNPTQALIFIVRKGLLAKPETQGLTGQQLTTTAREIVRLALEDPPFDQEEEPQTAALSVSAAPVTNTPVPVNTGSITQQGQGQGSSNTPNQPAQSR